MKKNVLFSMLIILGLGLIMSCTKTSNNTPSNNNNNNTTVNPTLTAMLGSNSWTATTVTGSLYSGTYINVNGTASDGSKIKVSCPMDIKAGTYTMGSGTQYSLSYINSLGTYTASNGNLVITSNADNIIKGSWNGADLSFYVNTQPTIGGTSGNFEVKYQ